MRYGKEIKVKMMELKIRDPTDAIRWRISTFFKSQYYDLNHSTLTFIVFVILMFQKMVDLEYLSQDHQAQHSWRGHSVANIIVYKRPKPIFFSNSPFPRCQRLQCMTFISQVKVTEYNINCDAIRRRTPIPIISIEWKLIRMASNTKPATMVIR